jgi:hypothetical protein
VVDRFGQIAPRILFAADGYFYNRHTIDNLPRLREIMAQIKSGVFILGGTTVTIASTGTINFGSGNFTVTHSTGGITTNGFVAMADSELRRPVLLDYGEKVNAIGGTGGGTQDIDLTLGNVVTATVDTSTNTFTFSNPSASGTACSFTLIRTNGGSQTVNWPASVDWPSATAPTLTASGVDMLTFVTVDAGTRWFGFAAGTGMA